MWPSSLQGPQTDTILSREHLPLMTACRVTSQLMTCYVSSQWPLWYTLSPTRLTTGNRLGAICFIVRIFSQANLWARALELGMGIMADFSLSAILLLGAEHWWGDSWIAAWGLLGLPLLVWSHCLMSQGRGDQELSILNTLYPQCSLYPLSGGLIAKESPYLLTIPTWT